MTTSATRYGRTGRLHRPGRSPGFTLIELLLVLAVIALVAALVGPSLQAGARRMGIDTSNHQLLSLLRAARAWSVRTGRVCLVTLEPGEAGYRAEVWRVSPDGKRQRIEADWARTESLEPIRELVRVGPGRRAVRGGTPEVRFLPWGVDRDYVIELDGTAELPRTRIEIRQPSGLARLTTAEEPGATFFRADPGDTSEMEAFWRSRCEGASP